MTLVRVSEQAGPTAPRGPTSTSKPTAPTVDAAAAEAAAHEFASDTSESTWQDGPPRVDLGAGQLRPDRPEPARPRPQPRIDFATGRPLPDRTEPAQPRPQPRIDFATGRLLPDRTEPARPRPQPRIDFATGRPLPDRPKPAQPRPQPRIDFATGHLLPDRTEPARPRPQPRIDFATGRLLPDRTEPAQPPQQPRIDFATGRLLPDRPAPALPRPQPRIDFATGRLLPDRTEPAQPPQQPRIDFATGRLLPDRPEPAHARPQPRIDFATGRPLPDNAAPTTTGTAVQRHAEPAHAAELAPSQVHATAAAGIRHSGAPLPHADRIQRAFGTDHDLSLVTAHVGGAAAVAAAQLGASAYAVGEHVAFASPPDLRLATHEAAHVVQQRCGVALSGGIGRVGDRYEREANAVADTVVAGRSAVDLLPRAASSNRAPSVQLDALRVDPIQAREDVWAGELEARADTTAPGEARARALRAVLLFEQGPDDPFPSADAVDRFAEHCQQVADNEADTLQELAGFTASADTLIDHGAAFPQTWAQTLASLGSGADHAALLRITEAAKAGALALASSIHDDVWNRGLPLSSDQALQLTGGNLLGSTLSLAHARTSSDEITARFARAALRWELATSHFYLVQLYDWELDHRLQEIRSGELVIDQTELRSLRTKHQALQTWLARFRTAETGHEIGPTIQTLLLRDPTRFHRVTGVSDFRFAWSTETIEAFRAEIEQVDRQIATASDIAKIWRAAAWASARGYNGAAAREVWEAMKDDAPKAIATLLSVVLLQAIPGVDVAVDLVLIMEFGADILRTAADLATALGAARTARSTVELQQASIHMARSLVGSAAQLALFAVTWGAGKATSKIARWRRGKQFVDRNSATPEAAAEARKALADAKGDVEAAEKLLRQRQEHARQQQELARAEQERLKAEREAKEADANRKAEDAAAVPELASETATATEPSAKASPTAERTPAADRAADSETPTRRVQSRELGLREVAVEALESLENIKRDPVGDINRQPKHNHYAAARREAANEVVARRRDGRPFSHIGDLQRAYDGLTRIENTLAREIAVPPNGMTERGLDVLLKKHSEVQTLLNRLGGFLNEIGQATFPPYHAFPPGS